MNDTTKPQRLLSLDAFRGFTMLAMASSGLGIVQMAKKMPDSIWASIAPQLQHVEWIGCAAWDLIQPAFLFIVGVAMPFSFARRAAEGASWWRQWGHAIVRAIVLVLLGVMLSAQRERAYVFTNTLAQIGLGYAFVFLLIGRHWRVQVAAVATILVGYWLAFALWQVPPADFDYAKVGANGGEVLSGFWAHWTKNTNLAAAFDRWFLNLLPQAKPFAFSKGGYHTLNFVPEMANMTLGLMAGEMLRRETHSGRRLRWLLLAGAACLALGWVASLTICPMIKRIWTPSFALWSAGWTLWLLAAFYAVIDAVGLKRWSFPLVVVGMNSIAIYLMAQLWPGWIKSFLKIHITAKCYTGPYGPMWEQTGVLLVLWLICWWLYRQRVFLRI
ncbi:MAG: DUF5009 domain-containing protein [Verrucomicrobia bacterium]|nr:DUF5009 domain-containing protein [Verrucomicrobiota bacterium]